MEYNVHIRAKGYIYIFSEDKHKSETSFGQKLAQSQNRPIKLMSSQFEPKKSKKNFHPGLGKFTRFA